VPTDVETALAEAINMIKKTIKANTPIISLLCTVCLFKEAIIPITKATIEIAARNSKNTIADENCKPSSQRRGNNV